MKEGDSVIPASKDAMAAIFFPRTMARIAVQAGQRELALQELEDLTQMSRNPISYGSLKFNPLWDPLRGDPRFEKIVASLAPKQ